jgi:hypothetical protein
MRRAVVTLVIYLVPITSMVPCTATAAGTSGDASLKQQYDEAFDAMYRDPGDLGKTLEYARLAAEIGDLEGAIGALERLLMFNPELTDIQFELGRLYLQLGSHEMARVWLTKALSGDLSDDKRSEATRDLADIARLEARNRFSGSLVAGFAYQTNANAGSSQATQIVGVVTPPGVSPKSDTNAYLLGNATHSYDLDRQDGTVLESNALLYVSRQFTLQTLNAGLLEIDSGPRFLLTGAGHLGTSIRPYLIANAFSLGDAFYFGGGGLGLGAATALAPDLTLQSALEFRYEWFNNSASQPNAVARTGLLTHGRLGLGYAASATDGLLLQFDATGDNAQAGFESYQEYGLSGSWTHTMHQPWSPDHKPIDTTLTLGHIWRPYSQPNPSIAPGIRQIDDEWDLGGSIRFGLAEGFFVQLLATQSWVSSTVAEFRYSNTTVSGSVGWQF